MDACKSARIISKMSSIDADILIVIQPYYAYPLKVFDLIVSFTA